MHGEQQDAAERAERRVYQGEKHGSVGREVLDPGAAELYPGLSGQ